MARLLCNGSEFENIENGLKHKPTGAEFRWYPGRSIDREWLGQLGSDMMDGNFFGHDDVRAMADRIRSEQLAKLCVGRVGT